MLANVMQYLVLLDVVIFAGLFVWVLYVFHFRILKNIYAQEDRPGVSPK